MRKLKLQVQMTIDGFITGTNGESDWMLFPWTDDLITFVREITTPVDTILLGRNLAEGFIPHWENVFNDPNDPEYEGGVKYTTTPKVVFSKTLTKTKWDRTVIANGDLTEEVNKLKNQNGGDLICYGGGIFVSSLIKANLIDELFLFFNPSAIGNGMPIFKELTEKRNYKAVNAKHFDCGIIVLQYNSVQI